MNLKFFLPYLLAFFVFVIASLAYFYPVLQGKELFQSDIAQFRGMSKEVQEFREKFKEEPYWTNRAFGGMPTYQLSTYYPHDYIKKLDTAIRFLPRPADYLFLYFFSFFILLLSLKIDWKMAVLGALAFGFSTYLIIILGVGHNAKAHAVGYMPLVLAGMILIFDKRYLPGFVITAIALALEIAASHPQMTYYLFFMVLIYGIIMGIDSVRNKHLPDFLKSSGLILLAAMLALGVNASSLLATKEYASESTRSKSELTINPDGSANEGSTGLTKDYITEYSYGILETFDLFIPRFMGGSNNEKLDQDSEMYNFLKDKAGRNQALEFTENAPMYWGDQPIVAAPAYLGAVVLFLFFLGIFLVKNNLKKWLVAATIFSILLSWGKNFGILTDLFIDYVPLYNKFRAVSSIQVIAELSVPLLGILGLHQVFSKSVSVADKQKALKYSLLITGGLALVFFAMGPVLFAFESFRDQTFESMAPGFADALVADRKSIFRADSLRSLILVLLTASVLWFYVKQKLNQNSTYAVLLLLVLFDLVLVGKRYVNDEDFISAKKLENPFPQAEVNREILKDPAHYRVMNFMVNPMNDGSTSFFHNSIGGYHAAKPRRYQELFDFQIAKNNLEVLNMLNTKYFIFPDDNNIPRVQLNEETNGNAWFVEEVKIVEDADQEIKALDSMNTKKTALVAKEFSKDIDKFVFSKDSTAGIQLKKYKANELYYESNSSSDQLAVFSEVYYKNGWNAYIDGVPTSHFRANYILRAMVVPKGKHGILFKFEPGIIKTGTNIVLVSYVLLLIIPLGWYFLDKKNKSKGSK